MRIISQVRLSTFDGGRSYSAEVKVGEKFYGISGDAVKVLISEHKRLGGIITRFPARAVTVKNAVRAAVYGNKVGDIVTVTDFVTRTMEFDADIGDGVVSNVTNIRLVTLTIDGDDLDLGEVKEVTAVAKPAVASAPADDDVV